MIRASSIDHLRFTVRQRPWSLHSLTLLAVGFGLVPLLSMLAMRAGLEGGGLALVIVSALLAGFLPGAYAERLERETTIEVHEARVRLRGWLGRWRGRPSQVDVSMDGLELVWRGTGLGGYHLIFRTADGEIWLPGVSCGLTDVLDLRKALEERLRGGLSGDHNIFSIFLNVS